MSLLKDSTNTKTVTELENLNEVRVGYKTDCFNKLSLSNKTKLSNVDCSKSKCLSLIFGNESAPLDLVSKDQNTRNKLAKVVTKLIEILNDPIGENIHNPLTLKKNHSCFVHPIFCFWFLVTFGDEVTKIRKYYVIFVYILQGKMGKTEKETERKSHN